MDLDVLYRVHKDLAYKHLKKYVDKNSIHLALFRACPDNYICKKTLWNIYSLLANDGILVVDSNPYVISSVLSNIKSNNYKHSIVYLYSNEHKSVHPFVLVYKRRIISCSLINFDNSNIVEGIIDSFINLCNVGNNVLLVGDYPLLFVPYVKKMCRNVVAFGNSEVCCQSAVCEGLREVFVND